MDNDKDEAIRGRAYQIWEDEGRPHGKHHEHWHKAARDLGHAPGDATGTDPHPGMLGDGTEEQNLNQPGDPKARITQEEVDAAFAKVPKA